METTPRRAFESKSENGTVVGERFPPKNTKGDSDRSVIHEFKIALLTMKHVNAGACRLRRFYPRPALRFRAPNPNAPPRTRLQQQRDCEKNATGTTFSGRHRTASYAWNQRSKSSFCKNPTVLPFTAQDINWPMVLARVPGPVLQEIVQPRMWNRKQPKKEL